MLPRRRCNGRCLVVRSLSGPAVDHDVVISPNDLLKDRIDVLICRDVDGVELSGVHVVWITLKVGGVNLSKLDE